MQAKIGKIGIALAAVLALTACGSKEPQLMNLTSSGPDEFAILPTKPLQMPEDLTALPEPAPGGASLTDPTPEADVVAALGGNPVALSRGGIAAGDGALVAHAGRFGTSGSIRGDLAAEDLEYRRKNDGRLLERLFNVSVYFKAYAPMSLDQEAELERWRKAGVRNVGAPPNPAMLEGN
ncbi:pyruvate/2-oxoglutarate dehydrogenase complex, dihydrolipoamide acyltransferase (E2) component [Rhodobacter veldkampii DSM 11550]|uniref:DUF3035 domain-containing protein n=1 Tax=Phaeovulum veldkampii DSM 11550 TaxID=1185920 RepID=A0A2T4JLL7_9RHOB|nr:DUF3035 domain-containing protein [Phaeovulum veldkampii]MBK5946653.1 pyruvate/2-oxoglutarate dehydrogenase complex, dihydrolipoamide acyltransferase (E2) component [Phaeovulum veldkampii DSM 11550]NCU19921.1 DUF3035 domain-containing protein [Candidatus Falkowbacteria bacterium]PTE18795.1 DUF3035 domain-containing protein [Phaeovulum veldkampii DSM 11550]TDQ59988.1 beta-barrel assembly complex subunit BamF [Phaeovulum veldkampii DSM 11550]